MIVHATKVSPQHLYGELCISPTYAKITLTEPL